MRVPAGVYLVGEKDDLRNPLRNVHTKGFSIGIYEITNAQFAEFVSATQYVTLAERGHNGMVFEPGLKEFRWIKDPTAYWKFPNGVKRGTITDKMDHPVTCISYEDAQAYCKWAKVRLPSLDEWEIAARAGTRSRYFFGDTPTGIQQYANIWHGKNHLLPDTSDGYLTTSPVGSFKPNAWGLYDVYGNVFELCQGRLPNDKAHRVHARGGSWWCSKASCCYFNSADIGTIVDSASFSNIGFRVVKPDSSSSR